MVVIPSLVHQKKDDSSGVTDRLRKHPLAVLGIILSIVGIVATIMCRPSNDKICLIILDELGVPRTDLLVVLIDGEGGTYPIDEYGICRLPSSLRGKTVAIYAHDKEFRKVDSFNLFSDLIERRIPRGNVAPSCSNPSP